MQKLLIICGPTATGKTALGISLAKKFNGEIISADSRQVYRGMDIGTGKDLPKNLKTKKLKNSGLDYYEIDEVKVFGYDLVEPTEDFSISQYLKFALKTISEINKMRKLPIIIGGTGFYIKGIIDGIPTLQVPRNEDLRNQLEQKSPMELYETLSVIDSIRAGSMNSSDKKNPRRLIRAIEVAQYALDHGKSINRLIDHKSDVLFVGLTSDKKSLEKRIEKRVDDRVKAGMKKEIENLLKKGVNWHNQSMYSLGYRQYRDFFEGDVAEEHIISEWVREEKKYAGRQMVWFKKDSRIEWFDITHIDFLKNVDQAVSKWYSIIRH